MNYFFSKKTLGFYPDSMVSLYQEAGSWPGDDNVVLIDEASWLEFSNQPESGIALSSDKNGYPVWVVSEK